MATRTERARSVFTTVWGFVQALYQPNAALFTDPLSSTPSFPVLLLAEKRAHFLKASLCVNSLETRVKLGFSSL